MQMGCCRNTWSCCTIYLFAGLQIWVYINLLDSTSLFIPSYTNEEFNAIYKQNMGNIHQIKDYKIVLDNQAKVDERSSGLIELLKYNYNFHEAVSNIMHDNNTNILKNLEPTPFIILSLLKFSVGIFTNNPSLYDDWIVKEFSIRNQKYSAVVNDFRCLAFYKIEYATYHQLVKVYQYIFTSYL